MVSNIIDNQKDAPERQLLYNVKKALGYSVEAKFAIGYFFLSGFNGIQKELNSEHFKRLRLLIGNTSDKETVEQLVEGHSHIDSASSANKKIELGKKKPKLENTRERFKLTLEGMDQTDENEQWMYNLDELIGKEKIKVRVFTRGRLHSKAYIFDYKPEQAIPGMAIVGSSNLSISGMTHNTELNLKTYDPRDHEELSKWFMEQWEIGEPFDANLVELLKASWPIADVTPYEIYLKTLYHLVEDRLEEEKEIDLFWKDTLPKLTKFQEVAVKNAIAIIKKYNGAFVSDVVGVGKTYIGSGILKYFVEVYGYKPLIICPKSLEEMWEDFNNLYELGGKVLSMGLLNGEREELLNKYDNYDIVLIDESHNFRYPNTTRYELLQPFTSTRKVILLTATPLNNTPWDIYNQIKLFHAKDSTSIPIAPADLKEFFKLVEHKEATLSSVLTHLLIRRTRQQIIKYYGKKDSNGRDFVLVGSKQFYFPKRELKTLKYSIDDVYEGIYDRIREYLSKLTLARYGLYDYVLPNKQDKHPYIELKKAGENLRGLVRTGLFKRFESSSFAFRKSIENFLKINTIFLEALKKGYVPAGEEVQKIIYESKIEEDEDIDEVLQSLEGLSGRYDINDFDVPSLKSDIRSDLEILNEIYEYVKDIPGLGTDAKLNDLLTKINSPELREEKILVFTEFVDTANYIYNELKERIKRNMEVITGDTKDRHKIVGRFAPRSNSYMLKGEKEIDILISTDVLSEGLNLQDGHIVINYDLHWNPVRLIQRIGRLDRIGSEAEIIRVFNFLPEKKLEENLKLKEKLDARIREIHATIGEDTYILHTKEMLNEEAMYAIYDERQEKLDHFEEEDDRVKVSEAEDIIKKLQKEDPVLFEKIKNISMGVRSAKQAPKGRKARFAFMKKGNYKKLYLVYPDGNILSEDEAEILKALKCDKNEPSLGIPPGYNNVVMKVKKEFSKLVKEAEEAGEKVKLTTGQRYVKKALNDLRKEVEQRDESKDQNEKEELVAKIVELEKAFGMEIPSKPLNRQLTMIKNSEVKGMELLKKLEQLYHEHKLAMHAEEAEKEEDTLTYIVCSEALE